MQKFKVRTVVSIQRPWQTVGLTTGLSLPTVIDIKIKSTTDLWPVVSLKWPLCLVRWDESMELQSLRFNLFFWLIFRLPIFYLFHILHVFVKFSIVFAALIYLSAYFHCFDEFSLFWLFSIIATTLIYLSTFNLFATKFNLN